MTAFHAVATAENSAQIFNVKIEQILADTNWQTGQIIGVSEMHGRMTIAVQVYSRNPINHIGMIEKDANSRVFVHEMLPEGPRKTALREFLYRSFPAGREPRYILVEPIQQLTKSEKNNLVKGANELLLSGIKYNFRQLLTNGTANCGEYVSLIYAKIGKVVAHVRDFRFSNTRAFGSKLHPVLKLPYTSGPVIMPADPLFTSTKFVKGNVAYKRVWSDQEILQIWEVHGDWSEISQAAQRAMKDIPVSKVEEEIRHQLQEALPNTTPIDPLHEEALRRLAKKSIPQMDVNRASIAELLNVPIPSEFQVEVKVNGNLLPVPRILFDIPDFLVNLHSHIESAGSSFILEFNKQKFSVSKPALGKGQNGIVYSVGHNVIKLSLPGYLQVMKQIEEAQEHRFWTEHALRSGAFSVPSRHVNHEFGFFSISDKNTGMSLTELLVRANILNVSTDNKVEINKDKKNWLLGKDEIKKIERALEALSSAMESNRAMTISASPNNIYVQISGNRNIKINSISLIDVGSVPALKESKLGSIESMMPGATEVLKQYGISSNPTVNDLLRIPGVKSYAENGETFIVHDALANIKTFDDYVIRSKNRLENYFAKGGVPLSLQNYLQDLETNPSRSSKGRACVKILQ